MITSMQLDTVKQVLHLHFDDDFKQQLSFEFLRCYSPAQSSNAGGKAKAPVSHKKMVNLVAVEPVGKHGFRLCFDDQHQAVYSAQLLKEYAHNRNSLWQQYVQALQSHGLSREAMIDIKQL